MQIPSDRDWAEMRRLVTSYFPDVVSLYTITETFNRYGEPTVVSGFVMTVSGQLNTPSGREREILSALKNEGVAIEDSMHLTLPYGTPIDYAHTVVTSGHFTSGHFTSGYTEWDVVFISPVTYSATTDVLITRKIVNGHRVREDG